MLTSTNTHSLNLKLRTCENLYIWVYLPGEGRKKCIFELVWAYNFTVPVSVGHVVSVISFILMSCSSVPMCGPCLVCPLSNNSQFMVKSQYWGFPLTSPLLFWLLFCATSLPISCSHWKSLHGLPLGCACALCIKCWWTQLVVISLSFCHTISVMCYYDSVWQSYVKTHLDFVFVVLFFLNYTDGITSLFCVKRWSFVLVFKSFLDLLNAHFFYVV